MSLRAELDTALRRGDLNWTLALESDRKLAAARADVARLTGEREALRQRNPTQEEAAAAASGRLEFFLSPWTMRKCRHCGDWLAGGPTACVPCVEIGRAHV